MGLPIDALRLQKYPLPIACFGHAGDGNIHVNVMVDENDARAVRCQKRVLDELFQKILRLGGAITGEHGIGLAKKPWWSSALPAEARELHRKVKRALDPNEILNPGKFV